MSERTVRSALRSETNAMASSSLMVVITVKWGKSRRIRSSTMVFRGTTTR